MRGRDGVLRARGAALASAVLRAAAGRAVVRGLRRRDGALRGVCSTGSVSPSTTGWGASSLLEHVAVDDLGLGDVAGFGLPGLVSTASWAGVGSGPMSRNTC